MEALKQAVYASGAAGLFHRWENGGTLTTVMFHRVLANDDPRLPTADPLWTLTEPMFRECLRFFRRHYQPVSLDDVQSAIASDRPLPSRALLVTFDDGWADTEDCAAKTLSEEGIPAVVFVVASAIESGRLWEEDILEAWQKGRLTPTRLAALASEAGLGLEDLSFGTRDEVQRLIAGLLSLGTKRAMELLIQNRLLSFGERMMLDERQVRRLTEVGCSIGSHGFSHAPMTLLTDPAGDFNASLQALSQTTKAPVTAFSFPHGAYNERLLELAATAGYKMVFTSDPVVHAGRTHVFSREGNAVHVFGRIPVRTCDIVDSTGRFSSARLAGWLFRRQKTMPGVVPTHA